MRVNFLGEVGSFGNALEFQLKRPARFANAIKRTKVALEHFARRWEEFEGDAPTACDRLWFPLLAIHGTLKAVTGHCRGDLDSVILKVEPRF